MSNELTPWRAGEDDIQNDMTPPVLPNGETPFQSWLRYYDKTKAENPTVVPMDFETWAKENGIKIA